MDKQITIVCGNLCSGKGYLCSTRFSEYNHIVVSDVVRSISQFTKRSTLGTTKHLDVTITESIIEQINITNYDKFIIDGIRQLSILKAIVAQYPSTQLIWLEVPVSVLKQRFEQRHSDKDDLSFDQCMQSDIDLGILEVEQHIKHHGIVVYG